MTIRAVVGLQWGDEGKGKIVDALGEGTDFVVRCQGGCNAGHTVVIGQNIFKLHHIPSGLLREGVRGVIGNGVVVDPLRLRDEMDGLLERGIDPAGRLLVSDRAHLNLPHHKALDALREKNLGKGNIGTTRQGIGPCYAEKANRTGLRGHHLADAEGFAALLRERTEEANRLLAGLGGEPLDVEATLEEILPAADRLRPFVADTVALLGDAWEARRSMLLEGAQGAMLDIDFGTYPYVTSSNTTAGGCATGSGLPPAAIDEVHGVLKAFTTRVGAGPFPTELEGEAGARLRGTGANQWDEFGTTTGRPRRCGWLDLVVGRTAARINGLTHLHITKLDVLGGMDEIRVAVAYRLRGERIETLPADLDDLAACEPEYLVLPGWSESLAGCRRLADLPAAARAYVDHVADRLGARIATVSYGPAREETIHCT